MTVPSWITLWRTLAVMAIGVIWAGSLWPADELRGLARSGIDHRHVHLVGYCLVALFLSLGWRQTPLWVIWLISAGLGVLAELAQEFLTASRGLDVADIVLNGQGALAGIVIGALLRFFIRRQKADNL